MHPVLATAGVHSVISTSTAHVRGISMGMPGTGSAPVSASGTTSATAAARVRGFSATTLFFPGD